MAVQKTQLWLNLSWNDERLQSLRLDAPRPVWLGETGDLVVPQAAIGAPRVLLLTHADGAWLHPDGRALALGEENARHFGDFVVHFQLTLREPHHLPLAWPQELAQLAAALALAIALVAMPLWLGGHTLRRHLRELPPQQELAAIVALPAYIDDLPAPEPPQDARDGVSERTVWFPPTTIDLVRPIQLPAAVAPEPPSPQSNPAKPPEPQPRPRQSPTRVAQEDRRKALEELDKLGVFQAKPTRLFGDPAPGGVEARNGTDVPHALEDPRQAARPELPDAAPRPHKLASNGDPELAPGRQDIVQVHSPRVERVEGNGLDAETVHAYIQRMHGQLRHCLELGMLGAAKLNGRVRVAFVIAADGGVLQAHVEESALHEPATETCIADRIRAWQFPAAASGLPTRVRHGFVFQTK